MDKDRLLGRRSDSLSGLPEGEVEVPGVGVVRVRGLTRYEVMLMRKSTDTDAIGGDRALVIEQKMLSMAMLDPKLSEEEVAAWQRVSLAGELEPVVQKVQELSGILSGAPKSSVPAS